MDSNPAPPNVPQRALTWRQKRCKRNKKKIKQKWVVDSGLEYAQRYNGVLRDVRDMKMKLKTMNMTTTRLEGEIQGNSLTIREKEDVITEQRIQREACHEMLKSLRKEITSHEQLNAIQDSKILDLTAKLSELEASLAKE